MPETPYTETHWGRFIEAYPRFKQTARIAAGIASLARELEYRDHDRWATGYINDLLAVAMSMSYGLAELIEDLVPEGDREIPF